MNIVRKALVEKTSNTYVQFFRYGFVAVASLAVDFSLLILFAEVFNMHYLIAASLSFIFGITTNYLLSTLWVFHSSKLENKRSELMAFIAIGLVGLLLTDLILWLCTHVFGVYYIASKCIAVLLVYFWNFGMRKYFLFN